jgi:hypothetical protein
MVRSILWYVKGMVVTRHVDYAVAEGERRWLKQNRHDECCHLYRKKLLVTYIYAFASRICFYAFLCLPQLLGIASDAFCALMNIVCECNDSKNVS